MGLGEKLKQFIRKVFFNPKWRCSWCGKEIFEDGYFCSVCESKLPFIDENYCEHCGRQLFSKSAYCSTCKENLTEISYMRSAFNYGKPINTLIKKMKYENGRYVADLLTEYLFLAYQRYGLSADLLAFVPMTEKAKQKRGFNQSELLCRGLALKTEINVFEGLTKIRETQRQAKLNRKERITNLSKAFRVHDKKNIKDKTVLIIDDVSTTGSTMKVLSEKLLKAGAKSVGVLTVASVPPKNGY